MHERKIHLGSRTVMVRDAGELTGRSLFFFHGTPGSRLDVSFGDDLAKQAGVRVVTFDRPGYGHSDPAPFSLRSIAQDVIAIADELGVDRMSTLGISGGGPFALAAAAVMGDRVNRVGVVAGIGPSQEIPGALDGLTDNDRLALSFLPDDRERAAQQILVGQEAIIAMRDDEPALTAWLDSLLGGVEAGNLPLEAKKCVLAGTREGLRQGLIGAGWDNISWLGPWDFSLSDVHCPVHLWYGDVDPLAPVAHGQWLRDHLPDAILVVYGGLGHIRLLLHWQEMLRVLTQ